MEIIPYLFVEKEQIITTKDWHQYLQENLRLYEKCCVRSVTHVKNLGSKVSHEYLQIIIEHGPTAFRTRVIAERQDKQDQIIIGRWKASKFPKSSGYSEIPDSLNSGTSSSSDSISSGSTCDLPLPLASLNFEGIPVFKVCDMALVLYQVTQGDPIYRFYSTNCYWFASQVYNIIKSRKPAPFEKQWTYSWVSGLPIIFTGQYKPEAYKFEDERESDMLHIPSDDISRKSLDPDIVRGIIREIRSPFFEDWVGDEWEIPTSKPTSSEEDTTLAREQFDLSIKEWCANVLIDEACDKNIELYDKITNQERESRLSLFESPHESVDLKGIEVIYPSTEQVALLDKALKARIGSVLAALPPEYSNPNPPEGERSVCATLSPFAGGAQEPDGAGRLAVSIEFKWEVGTTLRIRFLGGSEKLRERVERCIRIWEEHVNLRFEIVGKNEEGAQIRIGFDRRLGTWSCIGKKSLERAENEPTMNFSDLYEWTSDGYFQGTVLHEFGHALGCIHEHQSPDAGIIWDKGAVYDYYFQNHGWSNDMVKVQILQQYDRSKIRNSSLDVDSVMIYAINPSHTKNNFSARRNYRLSDRDKTFIAGIYPRESANGVDPNVLDASGGFPLYWAAAGGHYKQVLTLLREGADPNLRSRYQWTALHWAAGNGYSDIVRLLLDHNATVDVESDTGVTPLDLTRDPRIREALEEHAQIQRRGIGSGEQDSDLPHSQSNQVPSSIGVVVASA